MIVLQIACYELIALQSPHSGGGRDAATLSSVQLEAAEAFGLGAGQSYSNGTRLQDSGGIAPPDLME